MWALASVVALGAWQAPASSSLEWEAPTNGCPDSAVVEDRLRALLGDRVLEARVRARIHTEHGRWHAELTMRWHDHVDQRRLDADDCRSLAEATALLMAVMADPLHTSEAITRTVPLETSVPSIPPPKTPATTRGASASRPSPRLAAPADHTRSTTSPPRYARGLALTGSMLVDVGTLPRITPSPTVGVTWMGRTARLWTEAVVLPPRQVRSSAPYGQGRVLLGAGRAGACVRLGPGPRVEVPLCAGAELGAMTAYDFGATQEGRATDLWSAALTRASVVVQVVPALALHVGLEAVVPTPRIQYRHEGELLHATAPFALRGGFGLEIRLPSRKSASLEKG